MVKKSVKSVKSVKPRKPINRNSKNDVDLSIKIKDVNKVAKASSKIQCNKGCSHFWVFGSALAMILSYERSSSILWAILHGIMSWIYVLYRSMQIWGWF